MDNEGMNITDKPINNYQLSIVHYQLSIIHYQLSIVNCPLSIVNCPLSIVNCQLSIINCPLSIVNYQLVEVRRHRYVVTSVRVSDLQEKMLWSGNSLSIYDVLQWHIFNLST